VGHAESNEALVRRWHNNGRVAYQPITLDEVYVHDLASMSRFWLGSAAYDPELHGPVLYRSRFRALRTAHHRLDHLATIL
jgi:hypothetical protein